MVLFLGVPCTTVTDTGNARKEATDITKASNEIFAEYLPFENTDDFYNANKGFIGNSDDNMSFEFIAGKKSPDTVNPSLWRQSQLNNISGLFEVTPGIYQVRGFDLANITFIRGDTGWIVVDPLTTSESAEKALALFRKHKGNNPITGIIFTHSHGEHFGGIKGIVSEEELAKGIPENYKVIVANSVLKFTTGINGDADISISMSRDTFNQLLLKQIELQDVLGKEVLISNIEELKKFMLLFDTFEFWFNIVAP